uniref:Uncharacterized protein n=1 Tax=viral metagenome TaxID=1070528 RepID=A0A6C0H7S8_9ZZZZ
MYSLFYNELKNYKPNKIIFTKKNNENIVPHYHIPKKIKEYIINNIKNIIQTEIIIDNQKINFVFFIENKNYSVNKFENYVQNMSIWLKIMNKLCKNNQCNSLNLSIYIYFTKLKKKLPNKKKEMIDEYHVNGGYTETCAKINNEIVIYRSEEWFKVFIHETIHNRSFDFSDSSDNELRPFHQKILNLYKINSNVNLYEAYTETWARIIYILLISFNNQSKINYINKIDSMMKKEEKYMATNCSKIMKHFDITPNDFYSGKAKNIYKENTNVLSYYFLTYIFFINREKIINLGICFPKDDKEKQLNYLVNIIESNFFTINYPIITNNYNNSLKMMYYT